MKAIEAEISAEWFSNISEVERALAMELKLAALLHIVWCTKLHRRFDSPAEYSDRCQ